MFGDILVWVVTFFGLVPWDKLFGRKKDFQEQLEEFNDEPNCYSRVCDGIRWNNVPAEHDLPEDFTINGSETVEQVHGPWGVVRFAAGDEKPYLDTLRSLGGYTCRVGRRF